MKAQARTALEAEGYIARFWTALPLDARTPVAAVAFRAGALRHGFYARSTPSEFGGAGLPPDAAAEKLWRDACRRAGAPLRPDGMGLQLVAPTLLDAGDVAQKSRFLPGALTGAQVWCQGFSEPGAGSDLAALATRADRDGDDYVLQGQKLWTTHVDRADWILVLCRTDPASRRAAGLSFLMVDLRAPGVTVRPLRQITGETEFGEVFFDAVRVPSALRLGPEGEGWRIAGDALRHERVWIGEDLEDQFARLRALLAPRLRDGAGQDLAMRLAEVEGALLAHRYASLWRLERAAEGEEPALIDFAAKLYASEVMGAITTLALEGLGEGALEAPWPPRDDPGADMIRAWMRDHYWSLAYAIAGGSSHIQRDIIAGRGLALARAEERASAR